MEKELQQFQASFQGELPEPLFPFVPVAALTPQLLWVQALNRAAGHWIITPPADTARLALNLDKSSAQRWWSRTYKQGVKCSHVKKWRWQTGCFWSFSLEIRGPISCFRVGVTITANQAPPSPRRSSVLHSAHNHTYILYIRGHTQTNPDILVYLNSKTNICSVWFDFTSFSHSRNDHVVLKLQHKTHWRCVLPSPPFSCWHSKCLHSMEISCTQLLASSGKLMEPWKWHIFQKMFLFLFFLPRLLSGESVKSQITSQ